MINFKGSKKKEPTLFNDHKQKPIWTFITPNGDEYIINKEEKKNVFTRHHPAIQASDPQSGESMVTREDNLKIIYRSDNSMLVEYEDGTRITSFYSSIEMNLDPNNNSEANSLKKEKYVKIECPGFATTIFNTKSTDCTLVFGNGTLAQCDPKKMCYSIINAGGESIDIDKDGLVTLLPR